VLVVGGLLLASFSNHLQQRLVFNLPNKSSAQPKDKSPIVHERLLPSGALCRVALRATVPSSGRAERIEALEVSINGHPVDIPAEAFSDLRDVLVEDGVQVAEFADATFLLLSGGGGQVAWQAELTIRGLCAVKRELTRGSAEPEVTRFVPAPTMSGPHPLMPSQAISVQLLESKPIAKGNTP
jgi:hypothetical protein